MGTNFYVMGYQDSYDPEFHVGKRVGIADGKTCFKWAMTPDRFIEVTITYGQTCLTCGNRINKTFVDEFGSTYTVDEMLNIIEGCSEISLDSVGTHFS